MMWIAACTMEPWQKATIIKSNKKFSEDSPIMYIYKLFFKAKKPNYRVILQWVQTNSMDNYIIRHDKHSKTTKSVHLTLCFLIRNWVIKKNTPIKLHLTVMTVYYKLFLMSLLSQKYYYKNYLSIFKTVSALTCSDWKY